MIGEIDSAYSQAVIASPGTKFVISCSALVAALIELKVNEVTQIEQILLQIEAIEKIFIILKTITLPGGKAKPETETLKEYIKLLRENALTIQSLISYIKQIDAITDLYQMFDEFTCIVNASKRQTGNLTFADIQELALKILNEQEDIRLQEQAAYDKIMIDEFQDNNANNKDLLFLLADKKQKLFFVGDEKQSIYKFRGADVSVFNRLKTELGTGSFLQMNYNYRSNNELITTFNKIFGGNSFIFKQPTVIMQSNMIL